VCTYTQTSTHPYTHSQKPRQQTPHLRCVSELKTTKKINTIQSDSFCVRKVSRIRQLQENGERLFSFSGQALSLYHQKYKRGSKDIKNRNVLKVMKEYHSKKKQNKTKKPRKCYKIRAASVKTENVQFCIPTEPRIGKQIYSKDIFKILC